MWGRERELEGRHHQSQAFEFCSGSCCVLSREVNMTRIVFRRGKKSVDVTSGRLVRSRNTVWEAVPVYR